ncbi:MAG: T9SS type A sorting domain-containing protein [Bacteroidota bacterium]
MTYNFTNTIRAVILPIAICLYGGALFAQPANNLCADATVLTCGTTLIGEDTENATDQSDDIGCFIGVGVWYTFAGTGDNVTVAVTNDNIDVEVGVGSGSCGSITNISCTDLGYTFETVTFSTVMGTDYYIYIGDFDGTGTFTGTFDLAVTCETPSGPPANDLCSGAEVIVPTEMGTCVTGTNEGATDSGEAGPSCAGSDYQGGDIWYSITVPAGETQINYERTASAFSTTYYALYSGDCDGLVEEDCGTSTTDQFTGLTSGETYYLRLFDWGNNDIGEVTFCISTPAPPPANDACAGAISLTSGGVMMGTTANATNVENLSPCSGGTPGDDCAGGVNDGTTDFGPGVWYVYTSTESETITIEVDGFDTELQVFTGPCESLSCVAGDDDSSSSGCCGSQVCIESAAFRGAASVDYYIYVDGHATNSGSYTLSVVGSPLPVDLISFDGRTEKSSNMLMWKTASEENTEWHIIERSLDGRDGWQEVDRVQAAGFTSEQQDYMLEDHRPLAKAYYRLRSVDFDLSENISEVIYLERSVNAFDIISIFPNPTKGELNIDFEVLQAEKVTLTLTDMLGQTLSRQQIDANAGTNTTQFDMNQWTAGVYFINIANATNQITKRVLKN